MLLLLMWRRLISLLNCCLVLNDSCHASARNASYITRHTSYATHRTSHIARHTSHVTQPSLGVGYELGIAGSWFGWCFFVQCRYRIQIVFAINLLVLSTMFCDSYRRSFFSFFFCREVKKARVVSLSHQRRVCLQCNDNRQSEFDNTVRTRSQVTCHLSHVKRHTCQVHDWFSGHMNLMQRRFRWI